MNAFCVQPVVYTAEQEKKIIEQIQRGDQSSYAALIDAYKDNAYALSLKVTGNRTDAEEVAQDAFVKAYFALPKFKMDSKFSTWLYRIVFNTAVSCIRKRKSLDFEAGNQTQALDDWPLDAMEQTDQQRFLKEALAQLREADRNVLNLYYFEELSMEEVANILKIRTNAAKVKIHRARQRLGEILCQILNKEALTL